MTVRIAALNRFSRGWTAYFALADTPSVFEELDEWLRRRLRQVRWKEWKKSRGRFRGLLRPRHPGLASPEMGRFRPGLLAYCGFAHPSSVLFRMSYWQELGLAGFLGLYRQLRDARRTAGCGPACPVVWEGPG